VDFEAIAAAKAEERRGLIEALTQTPAEVGTSARAQLEALLGAETLAELDERLLATLMNATESGSEPLLDVVAAAQEARRQRVVDAVLGRSPQAP
jgi:hypothetical protein